MNRAIRPFRRSAWRRSQWGVLSLLLLLGGCTGVLTGAMDGEDGEASRETPLDAPARQVEQQVEACEEFGPGAGAPRVVRLSAREYQNTIRALFEDEELNSGEFIQAAESHGYVGATPTLRTVSQLDAYMSEAERLAELALESLPSLPPRSEWNDEESVRVFVTEFGVKALRRPLTRKEVDEFYEVYSLAAFDTTPEAGMRWLLRAFFAAPELLYLIERGTSADPQAMMNSLSGYERASRLSYFSRRFLPTLLSWRRLLKVDLIRWRASKALLLV